MSTALTLNDRFTALQQVADEYGTTAIAQLVPMLQTLRTAEGLGKLDALITEDLMRPVMQLQGCQLGFLTDKDTGGGYPLDTVKRVFMEATLRGLRMTGNEVNIISGKCYAAKNGLHRLVLDWPGMAEFDYTLSVPRAGNSKTVVDAVATWKLNGEPHRIDAKGEEAIPVRVNAGMGDDAVLGKAARKLFARVLDKLIGRANAIPDGEIEDARTASTTTAKVQRSTLNDTTTDDPVAIQEYRDMLKASTTAQECEDLAKHAASHEALSLLKRTEIESACTAKARKLAAKA